MNFEFNNFTPQLVVQLFLGSSIVEENKDLFTRDLYNTIFSSAVILQAIQNLPGEKNSIEEFEFAPYSLEGIYKLIEEDDEYLINLIIDDIGNISNTYSNNGALESYTDPIVTEYLTDKLMASVEYLKFEVLLNQIRHDEILQAIEYIKTKEDELIKEFNQHLKHN